MYIDGVILFSLLMIALILWMMGYVGLYAYRHIREDTRKAEEGERKMVNNNEKHDIIKQAA